MAEYPRRLSPHLIQCRQVEQALCFAFSFVLAPHARGGLEIPGFDGSTIFSSCIDAGDNSLVTAPVAIDGNARIQGAAVDIGCWEAPEFIDTDRDGMRDSWEMTYFKNLLAENYEDPDFDGLINIGESIRNFDPLQEFNVLNMIAQTGPDTATILWNSMPSHEYRLWESTDHVNWFLTHDWQTGTGDFIQYPVLLNHDKIVYRVEYRPLP